MKRLLAVVSAVLLLASSFGCGRLTEEEKNYAPPAYTHTGRVFIGNRKYGIKMPKIDQYAFWVADARLLYEQDPVEQRMDANAPQTHTLVWQGESYTGTFQKTVTFADGFVLYYYTHEYFTWRVYAETGRVADIYHVPEGEGLSAGEVWLTADVTDDDLKSMVMGTWPDFADEACAYAIERGETTYQVTCTPPAEKNPAGEQMMVEIRPYVRWEKIGSPTDETEESVVTMPIYYGANSWQSAVRAVFTTGEGRAIIERFDEDAREELLVSLIAAHLSKGWQIRGVIIREQALVQPDDVIWVVEGWADVRATAQCSRREVKQIENSLKNQEKGYHFRFLFQLN